MIQTQLTTEIYIQPKKIKIKDKYAKQFSLNLIFYISDNISALYNDIYSYSIITDKNIFQIKNIIIIYMNRNYKYIIKLI